MEPKQLQVLDLRVSYRARTGHLVSVLEGLNLEIGVGETIGLLGPSGSGKSTLGLAAAGMLPKNARVMGGSIRRPRSASPERDVTAFVHQEPARVLSPFRRVGDQIADVVQSRFGYKRAECKAIAIEGIRTMQFDAPDTIYSAYPHELSGGQRQRIVIAQAFVREASLIIADEPTSALDTVTQKHTLQVLQQILERRSTSMLLISHDPLVLLSLADRIAVIRDGRIVEENATKRLWSYPEHPYTRRVLAYARLQPCPSE